MERKSHAAFWNAKMRQAEENSWRRGSRPTRTTVSELLSYVNTPRDVLAFKKNPDAFVESKRAIRRSRWPRLRAWWEAFLHRHIIYDGPI